MSLGYASIDVFRICIEKVFAYLMSAKIVGLFWLCDWSLLTRLHTSGSPTGNGAQASSHDDADDADSNDHRLRLVVRNAEVKALSTHLSLVTQVFFGYLLGLFVGLYWLCIWSLLTLSLVTQASRRVLAAKEEELMNLRRLVREMGGDPSQLGGGQERHGSSPKAAIPPAPIFSYSPHPCSPAPSPQSRATARDTELQGLQGGGLPVGVESGGVGMEVVAGGGQGGGEAGGCNQRQLLCFISVAKQVYLVALS
jgi:hypothetical protein